MGRELTKTERECHSLLLQLRKFKRRSVNALYSFFRVKGFTRRRVLGLRAKATQVRLLIEERAKSDPEFWKELEFCAGWGATMYPREFEVALPIAERLDEQGLVSLSSDTLCG